MIIALSEMEKLSNNRNGTSIFAERTQKNLEHIVIAAMEGDDVHPVTQAVSALLGIVIFPWELSAFDIIKKKKLPQLVAKGWPMWKMEGKRRVIEVKDLLHVLRNSIAHGKIEFDSDSRKPEEVQILFTNTPEKAEEPDWKGSIRGDQLIEFCKLFSTAIKECVD